MASKPRPLWPLYMPLVALFGAYNGINQMIGLRAVKSIAQWKPFVWELTSILVIGALVPLVIRFEDRFRLDARPRIAIALAHLAGAVVFSVAHTTIMVLFRKLIYAGAGEVYTFGNVLIQGFYELQKDLITYATILVIVFAIREFRVRRAGELRAAQLVSELSEARLRHLTTQVEPHFLFNSLNAISNRMHEDVAAVTQTMAQGILHERLQQQARDLGRFQPGLDLDLEGELAPKALGHHARVTPQPT